jgi:hypothetical protein
MPSHQGRLVGKEPTPDVKRGSAIGVPNLSIGPGGISDVQVSFFGN